MKGFSLSPLGAVRFGRGTLESVDFSAVGERPLVVRGGAHLDASGAMARLESARGGALPSFTVRGEPTIATIDAALAAAREADCTGIIALGGGAVLDAAKATAAVLANGGEALDYLEVIGRGRPITQPSLPLIAVPTTAGTGSEVTRNAVLGSPEHGVKVSMRSPHLVPALAVVDPSLTDACPPAITAPSALDALTQVIEPFLSTGRNAFCDALCRDAIERSARSIRAVVLAPTPDARDDIAYVALLSGICLTNAGLGAVHGFAGPLGGMRPIAHGAICAALLPHVMRANFDAAAAAGDADILARFDEIGRLLTGEERGTAGIDWLFETVALCGIPGLGVLGVEPDDIAPLVAQSRKASSMRYNPFPLTDDTLRAIVEAAM